MLRVRSRIRKRHLVRTKRPFVRRAVDRLGAGPPLRRTEHDHRPARTFRIAPLARLRLNSPNVLDDRIERCRHGLVHDRGFMAHDVVRRPSVSAQQLIQFFARNAREDGGIGDFVAVKMEDGQHRPISGGVEELVRVPRRRERSGLCLAVANDTGHGKIRIVENGAKGMAQRVAELAPFVDGARALGRGVAWNAAGK